MEESPIAAEVRRVALAARAAGRALSVASTSSKDAVLRRAAMLVRAASDEIVARNTQDVRAAQAAELAPAMLDRLRLDAGRVEAMARALEDVAALPDPVGAIDGLRRQPSGIVVGRMRVPLGLVGIIYESRPNVTAEAASLCIKSGNAVLLRGGKEAIESNTVIARLLGEALASEGLDAAGVTLLPTTDRDAMRAMIRLDGVLDLLIPRGGEGLIRFVTEHATVPVIQHYKGVCHVYVDESADLDMAERITLNAKTQRPGVCNALETLLVDAALAQHFVPRVVRALRAAGVEVRGCERTLALAPDVVRASDADWDTEHLALVLNLRVVDGIEGAMAHVREHGSLHTESIVTGSHARAQRWLREVDASAVMVNASTRFNDGGQLGLGAEMGISTSKLHAYGPMGLEELCTRKWVVYGEGQTRS